MHCWLRLFLCRPTNDKHWFVSIIFAFHSHETVENERLKAA
jgi:hypothetical protein